MTLVEDEALGERVVGSGADAFDRVRARVEALARVGDPSLVVPSRVTMLRGDEVAVIEPHSGRDTLRTVLNARGALRVGECVWLGTAIAAMLASLHKAGIAHGALDADAVVIDRGGVRLSRLVDGRDGAVPADDIGDLGRLLASAVRESEADRIVAWAEPMTHEDPALRPTAAMVARALRSCAPPKEIEVPAVGVASALRRAASRQRDNGPTAVPLREARWWRLRLRIANAVRKGLLVIAALGLLGGVGMGAVWVAHSGPWAGHVAAGGVSASDALGATHVAGQADQGTEAAAGRLETPDEAGARLTLARFAALARGDGEALAALTAPGTPARADAEATGEALEAGLLTIDGLEGTVEDAVTLEGVSPGDGTSPDGKVSQGAVGAVVRVRYRLGPHVVTEGGSPSSYEGYEQTVDLSLEWVDGYGWLVASVAQVRDTDGEP